MIESNYIEKQLEIYEKKNKDYGNSFYNSMGKYGVVAYYVRAEDKLNRLAKLIQTKEQAVEDESVTDTIDDLFNYTAMYLTQCMVRSTDKIRTSMVKANMQFLIDVGFSNFLEGVSLVEEGSDVYNFINSYYGEN